MVRTLLQTWTLATLTFLGLPAAAQSAPPPLRSAAVMVRDQRTGQVLFQKDPESIHAIASITKLMTAMVVLDACQELDEVLVVKPEDKDLLRHSKSHLPVGTRLTRREALLLALMASENRAAHALGRTYPGGREACVATMNAKAQSLGLTTARFQDTSGLHAGNVACAKDLARLVEVAYSYPRIREYSTTPSATLPAGRGQLTRNNSNRLVASPQWTIGLSKTGFIAEAGRCLVMQAQLAARPVVIVLLDSFGKFSGLGDAMRLKKWLEGTVTTPLGKRRR